MMMGQEPRQTTSNVGHLAKPSIQALIHGLNRHYYSMAISYRKSALEERMLGNLQRRGWAEGLALKPFDAHAAANEAALAELEALSAQYGAAVAEEGRTELDKRAVAAAGKADSRRRLEEGVGRLLSANVVQCMGAMLDTVAF
jgi:26S proteasome regulatory subunit N11